MGCEVDGGLESGAPATSEETEGGPATESETEPGSDTETETAPLGCEPWTLDLQQAFHQEDMYGDDPLTGLPNEQGPGVALGDLDGDGDLDAVLAVGAGRSIGFRNDGGALIRDEVTITADGGPLPHANSVAIADLDGDGDDDVVLARGVGHADVLLWNDGTGAFTTAELPNSTGESVTIALGDVTGDGQIDVLIAGFEHLLDPLDTQDGTARGDGTTLYVQASPGSFVDATDRLPESIQYALTYHAALVDYDADHDLDIYLSNDFGNLIIANEMLQNDGSGNFTIDDACACDIAKTCMGVSVADLSYDGAPDLFMTDWGMNWYLLNDGGGGFIQAQEAHDVVPDDPESEVAWGSRVADLNLDGWLDAAIAYGPILPDQLTTSTTQMDAILLGDGSGDLHDVTLDVGFGDRGIGRTIAQGDLDRDGRPDLVVAGRVYMLVYLSRGGCPNGVTVTLDAGPGNPHGVGASVQAHAATATVTQYMLPSSSFGQSATELYIGMADAPTIDLTVVWPDGSSDEVLGVPPGPLHLER
jgi:hypothetical protein